MNDTQQISNWWQSDWLLYLCYGLLSLVIMAPLLLPGFILTIDMVFVPHVPLPESISNSYLFDATLHYASRVIPADALQKCILLAILLVSGVGMHKLVTSVRTKVLDTEWAWAPWFAGVFYVINPFVYTRFMAGQYKILLGYMLLPLIVLATLKFLARPSLARLWPLALFVLLVSIFSVHVLGFVLLLLVIITAVSFWRRHTKDYLLSVAKYTALGITAFLILSSYWLIPAMLGQGEIAGSVASFTSNDTAAFATDGGLFTVLQLRGFWLEAQGLFMSPRDPLPLSGIWQLALWLLIALGVRVAWKVQRPIAIIFGITGLLGILLALGTPLNTLLARIIPFFAGYREPQKFVALLALTFAYFGAFGLAASLRFLAQRSKSLANTAVPLAMVLLIFLNTPTMLWGFYGQLTPRNYPSDWYAMDQELQKQDKRQHVLFLPWHLYMKFSYTQRVIANPADKFFNAPVITSNDPEYAGVSPEDSDQIKATLNNDILPTAHETTDLAQRLSDLNIGYVLLSKEEKDDYAYLDAQPGLEILRDSPNLKLYKITSHHAAD